MKKILSIVIVGLCMLILLSFIPSNIVNSDLSAENDDGYLTLVPVKPPAGPPIK